MDPSARHSMAQAISDAEVEARAAEIISADFVHGATRWRSGRSTAQTVVLAMGMALMPLVPALGEIAAVDPRVSVAALGVWCVVIVVASVALRGADPRERLGTWLGFMDTFGFCTAAAVLIAGSAQIVNVYWAMYGFFVITLSGATLRWRTHAICLGLSLSGLVVYLVVAQRGGDAMFSAFLGLTLMFMHRSSRDMAWRIARERARSAILGDRASAVLVEVERDRIARELHDGVAAELTSALWMAHAGDGEEAASQIQRGLASLTQVVRNNESRPMRAAELVERLQAICASLSTSTCPVTFSASLPGVEGEPDPQLSLDGQAAEHVLRIAQEGIRNAARHAGGRSVAVFMELGDEITLEVADDGRGLSVDPASRERGGLRNLRERAAQMGGTITWEAKSPGTRMRLCAPLAAESDATPAG